ncbi:MAG: tRNA dihydrouridine synthase DusB [Armatimonadetes bacterium]|nr:tRNA dihydrouridine synthase DusB [Armatimonadota bacterium]
MAGARRSRYPGFRVGPIAVDPPLLLAPMEDVTSLPFRVIAKRIARPGLMFTEFVSAMAIHHGAAKTLLKMKVHPEERPLGIQIFGGEPEIMAETARLCEEMGADLVDINMGCWVPKVCRTGAGAALLKDPVQAEKIVKSVVSAVRVPVTVKVRAGWDWSLFAAPDLAKRFQDAGAQMLTLHARFAKQGFEGEADWSLIASLRKALQIPLVGNGDVKTGEDARRMMDQTGCDGVMVGRAAISNPWALSRIRSALDGSEPVPEPSLAERSRTALEHLRHTVALEAGKETWEELENDHSPSTLAAEDRACRKLRGQLPLYFKGFDGAARLRSEMSGCSTVAEYQELMEQFLQGSDGMAAEPVSTVRL